MKPISLFLIIAVLAAQAQAGSGLTVLVRRGEGSKARAGETSANRIEVLVTDAGGRPVPNATVTFTLPREGASGVFASGLTSESVITAGDGTASVSGICWGDSPGVALVQIKASRDGVTGAAVVTVELLPGTGEKSAVSKGSGRSRWILAAAAAGAALAGVAFAGGKGSSSASGSPVTAPVQTAPTVGAPIISIGKP